MEDSFLAQKDTLLRLVSYVCASLHAVQRTARLVHIHRSSSKVSAPGKLPFRLERSQLFYVCSHCASHRLSRVSEDISTESLRSDCALLDPSAQLCSELGPVYQAGGSFSSHRVSPKQHGPHVLDTKNTSTLGGILQLRLRLE